MSANPPEENPAPRDEGPGWLLQFYTVGKSIDQTDAGPSQLLPDFAISPAEKYLVGEELGSGGMKSVLRTFESHTERHVAMAVLRDPSVRSKKMARFVREARITAALEHPNIVPVYDIGLDGDGKPYFTMKLLGGETLQSILQQVYAGNGDYRARYPLNSLLRIFLGICNAISFAHSRGAIHLDLKPANVQVGDFGEVLVLDWGLAKVLEKDPILYPNRLVLEKSLNDIASAGIAGTPGFMSPEQSRGENDTLDERTDIYALGAILFTILNCRKSSQTDRRAQRENAKIPAALEAVTAKAMSDLPERRYQAVDALALDVRAYLDGYATKAQQAGALTILWLLIKRHFVVTALAAVSLVTVFGILTTSLILISNSERKAVESKQRAEDALARFKEEQARTYQVGLVAAPQVMVQANDALQSLNYDQALPLLEHVVALDKNTTDAWWDLAAIYLGRSDFDEASAAFSHLPKSDPAPPNSPPLDLQSVLAKYESLSRAQGSDALKKARNDFVHDINFATHTAWPFRQLSLAVLFKDMNRNPKTVDYDAIEKALRCLNADATDLVFTHESTPMGLKITMHGTNLGEISPLVGLPISVMDASHTGSMDLTWLNDAPLIFLDLSESSTWSILPLEQSSTLQEMRLVGWLNKDYTRLLGLHQLKRLTVDAADVMTAQTALKTMPHPPEIIGQ